MGYKETHAKLIEGIKALVTPENADVIAGINALAGEMLSDYEKVELRDQESRDALVRTVTSTPVKQGSAEPPQDPTHISNTSPDIDALIVKTANDLIKARPPK